MIRVKNVLITEQTVSAWCENNSTENYIFHFVQFWSFSYYFKFLKNSKKIVTYLKCRTCDFLIFLTLRIPNFLLLNLLNVLRTAPIIFRGYKVVCRTGSELSFPSDETSVCWNRIKQLFLVLSHFLVSVLYTVGKILHRCKQTSRGN